MTLKEYKEGESQLSIKSENCLTSYSC